MCAYCIDCAPACSQESAQQRGASGVCELVPRETRQSQRLNANENRLRTEQSVSIVTVAALNPRTRTPVRGRARRARARGRGLPRVRSPSGRSPPRASSRTARSNPLRLERETCARSAGLASSARKLQCKRCSAAPNVHAVGRCTGSATADSWRPVAGSYCAPNAGARVRGGRGASARRRACTTQPDSPSTTHSLPSESMVMPSGTPPTAPCTLAPWHGQVMTVRRLRSEPAAGSKSNASTALVAVSIQYIVRPSALHVRPFGSRALGMTVVTCSSAGAARAVVRAAERAQSEE